MENGVTRMAKWVKSTSMIFAMAAGLAACGHDVNHDEVTEKNLVTEQVTIDSSNLDPSEKALFDRFTESVDTGKLKLHDHETVGGAGGAIQAEKNLEAMEAAQARQEQAEEQQQQAAAAAAAAQEAQQQREAQAQLASAASAQLAPDGKSAQIHNASGQQIYCYEGYIDLKTSDGDREAKAWFMYHSDDGLGANNSAVVPLSSVEGADLSGYPLESLSEVLVPVSVRFTQYGSGIEAPSQDGHC